MSYQRLGPTQIVLPYDPPAEKTWAQWMKEQIRRSGGAYITQHFIVTIRDGEIHIERKREAL